MTKKINSFVFYRSFLEGIKELEDEEKLSIFFAISEYALDGKLPQLTGAMKALFLQMKAQIDANEIRRENGRNGGAPKGNSNAKKQPKTTKNNQKQPNENENDNGNVNVNENEKFFPPTLDDIKEFCISEKIKIDTEKFFIYYTSRGWNGIEDWKSTVKYWEKKDKETRNSPFGRENVQNKNFTEF